LTAKELTQFVAQNTLAIAENTRAIAENSKTIAQLTNMVLATHESIKSLETVAESLLESANKHEAVIQNLEHQWQAYIKTLPKN
jgi:tetrahydromethanopterin S-methyltransferase subunit B